MAKDQLKEEITERLIKQSIIENTKKLVWQDIIHELKI
jgi:hypothetical protein